MENQLEQAHEQFKKVTPREMEIIREMADGLNTREIASKLGIAFATTENHRHNIMKKTGLRNTAHIVATFIRARVIA